MAAIALGGAIAMAVACGTGPRPPAWQLHQQKSNEITALWTQIRQWRSEAKMNLDPAPQLLSTLRDSSVRDAAKVCRDGHAVPSRCNDICSIADNICDNAERICTLAEELGRGDDFAQQKCTSAKASCREAKQRCCGCSDDAPEDGAP